MFKDNKYTKIYYQLVNRACSRVLDGYKERHHIIPKCIGGDNTPCNIIELTAREHFICHKLLTKMSDHNSLKYALVALSIRNPHQSDRYRISSRDYEIIKKMNSKLASERFTGRSRPWRGMVRAYNPETLELRVFPKGQIPDTWIRGVSPKVLTNMISKNRGRKYYHDPITRKSWLLETVNRYPRGIYRVTLMVY